MLVPISNTPRDYAWGSRTAIAELSGREPSGAPEAELWLGTHPGSPARLGSGEPLTSIAGELPFLLKILAADAPLSLQAHPTIAQAEDGFAREEAAGIPLDAPERNYRDRLHKPELIYALSDPFRALCGFRPVAETRALLAPVADDPRIAGLLDRIRTDDDLEAAFAWLIGGGDEVDELVAAIVEASAVEDDLSWEVVRRLSETSPGDPGIAISLLLHAVDLRPGEALYLPAGNIHAYVHGVGIELMAASDNVLRGGLTPKHVDVPELVRVLDFTALPVPRLRPSTPCPGVAVFTPDGPDFELMVLDADALARGVEVALDGRPAIVLELRGSASVDELALGGSASLDGLERASGEAASVVGLELTSGEAAFASSVATLGVRGSGIAFVASTSRPASERPNEDSASPTQIPPGSLAAPDGIDRPN